jgi:DNA polymerase III delta prime subunit
MDNYIKHKCIGHKQIVNKLNNFIINNNIPNIIFQGPYGSGKKTIVIDFINNIYKQTNTDNKHEKILWVNCDHSKGIKFIRTELKFFSKLNINNGIIKCVILLNADKLTIDAQSALRRSIEVFNHNTRYFIVVENKNKLLKPILSRFCDIYVPELYIETKVNKTEETLQIYNNHIMKKGEKSIINFIRENNKTDTFDLLINKQINKLYLMGISADSLIKIIENSSYFDTTNNIIYLFNTANNHDDDDSQDDGKCDNSSAIGTELSFKKYYELVHIYNKIKEDIRNEELLMLFIINFLFINKKYDLKNISFM